MSKSVPAAPDYTGAAEAQAASSRNVTEQQTWANRPTINTPFGQQTWSTTPQWDPSTGQYLNTWEMNTNLTPEAQSALTAQQDITAGRSNLALGMLGRAQGEYGQPMDWNQFTDLAQTPQTTDFQNEDIQRGLDTSGLQGVDSSQKYNTDAENAIYGKFASRMDPQFQREAEAKRTQLYNSGLREGDEAYDQAMKELDQNQNDARQQAQYQSIIGGGAEAQRMQGMDLGLRQSQFGETQAGGAFANSAANQAMQQQLQLGGAQFGQETQAANYQNTLRQQQISEEMQRRGLSLNEINAILTGQQVGMPTMPGFNSAQRSEATQYNQAAQSQGQYNIDAFNAQQQATQGMMQGATGAMMLSDRRLKKNIQHIGYEKHGYKVYTYEYIWGEPGIGVMSDEIDPKFVVRHPSGYDMVNYGLLKS